jgi:ABC-2 type transport system permease protein
MRNVFLIARREYLERVRTKAFLIFTFLMPALMAGLTILPAKLMMTAGKPKYLLVVTTTPDFGNAIQDQLGSSHQRNSGVNIIVTTSIPAETTHETAEQQLSAKRYDSVLWATDEALSSGGAVYTARESSDFIEREVVHNALQSAISRQRLAQHGITASEAENIFKPAGFTANSLDKQGVKDIGQIISVAFTLMVLLYVSVLTYGLFVMRAVIEEKSSRVMEVMLSSVTSQQLMAGKILGVGAVGLTQIAIWFFTGALLAAPGAVAVSRFVNLRLITASQLGFFALFFLLGYFLYSAMCAALGAMCNSDQEAQQLTLFVVMPLAMCMAFAWAVIRSPNSPLSIALSMIPFCSPLLMFMRIMVQQPPAWQIALSIGILLATIYALLWICSRIYRVGILMYGKRPTLPEIVKWIRYAY